MTFEFMYGDDWYKYEDGWIHNKPYGAGYFHLCPVERELKEQLETLDLTQRRIIMSAIIHGYTHGRVAGQKDKIREFKRMFQID